MSMRLSRLLSIALPLAAFASGAAQDVQPPAFDFEFKGPSAAEGWGKTASIELAPQEDCLKLNGNGWDSKIYRAINLEPGYYLLTATGKGESIHVKLVYDLGKAGGFFNMNISRDAWRTDWRPFAIEKPVKAWLLVHLENGGKAEAMIKRIRIEKAQAPAEEPGIPSVAELERQRPNPEIVRGCTFPGGPEQSFADLRSWQANVARKWISTLKPARYVDGVAEYDPGWESQLAKTEEYLENARKAGLKVVLTLNGDAFHKNAQNASWDNPKLAQAVASVWKGIAQRLLPYRDVIYGYDLYNEPLDWTQMPNAPRQWRAVAIETVKAIREVDKESWIIYETGPGGLSWGFANMKPLPDSRVIYSVHFYSPHEFTHQGIYNLKGTDLAEVKAKLNVRYPGEVNGLLWNKEQIKRDLATAREFQLKYHVPMLVGEFSVIRWAPKEDAAQYLKDLIDIFEEYHWSWVYHGFREWGGWSVENDEEFAPHEGPHNKAASETERAKIVKAGLARNGVAPSGKPEAKAEEPGLRSQLETLSSLKGFSPDPSEFRIYFIGDSITRHGFNQQTIEKLKWDHIAGMAASSEDKDFAHLVAAEAGKISGKKVKIFFGRGGDAVNALKGVNEAKAFQPALVVVQLGEHVPSKDFGAKDDDSREKIAADYAALLDALQALPSAPAIVCTGIWNPMQNWAPGTKKYFGRTALIEEVQAEVSKAKGIPFASVEKYALDPACSGTGGSNGVKWHPNDEGQAGYAKEIIGCCKDAFAKTGK